MGNQARNYTPQTLKKLFALSGNRCAFPGCTKTLVNTNNAKDSNICHIEAANEDGERYNSSMTDKERADYSNLILLCIQHHDETNNVEKYTVNVLEKMKQNHESNYLNQTIKNNPSMLKNTINAIANINLDNFQETEDLNVFDPGHKIHYNSIKRNLSLIQEYKVYHKKINLLYDELELQGSIKKEKLLSTIRLIYLKIKGYYILDANNPLKIIRQNSDNIIDDIYDELYAKMEKSSFWDEDIILGIRLIMVDAFMRCKILEEPQKDDNK
jgi:ABC-3C protein